jgi:hypothetical protein
VVARIRLCEPELREYACAVEGGQARVGYPQEQRRVGLFWVYRTWSSAGEARMTTGYGFKTAHELVYRENPPPPVTYGVYRHIYGPWYSYVLF